MMGMECNNDEREEWVMQFVGESGSATSPAAAAQTTPSAPAGDAGCKDRGGGFCGSTTSPSTQDGEGESEATEVDGYPKATAWEPTIMPEGHVSAEPARQAAITFG